MTIIGREASYVRFFVKLGVSLAETFYDIITPAVLEVIAVPGSPTRFDLEITNAIGTVISIPVQSLSPKISYRVVTVVANAEPEFTQFHNEEFIPPSGGVAGTFSAKSVIQQESLGLSEFRISLRAFPLFSGRLTNLSLNRDEMEYVAQFFASKQGKGIGFRWKNPADYKVTALKRGNLEKDPDTWTIGGVMETSPSSIFRAHAAKIYASHGYEVKKPIRFARQGTGRLYRDGVYVRDIAIDSDGSFDLLGSTTGVSIETEYDTLVHFDINELPGALVRLNEEDGTMTFDLPDIPIVEKMFPEELFLAGSPENVPVVATRPVNFIFEYTGIKSPVVYNAEFSSFLAAPPLVRFIVYKPSYKSPAVYNVLN